MLQITHSLPPPQSDMVCSNLKHMESLIIFQVSYLPSFKRVFKGLLSSDMRSVSSPSGVGSLDLKIVFVVGSLLSSDLRTVYFRCRKSPDLSIVYSTLGLGRLLSLDLRSVSSTSGVGRLFNLDMKNLSFPSGQDGPFSFDLSGHFCHLC